MYIFAVNIYMYLNQVPVADVKKGYESMATSPREFMSIKNQFCII